ncbi:hypothetical protein [Chryseobacterium sp. SL1]|uniref:hypothetical protein n=1 Tax=Chryseobacterium sp. SL1 TaxID=2995159 RepID=UPI0022769480|nr:hypothetical protein [Chryseobacterium sp. SL1]MCY1662563.1 hypothetical protein [Chryseobacterium sp. SL1]
MKIGDLRIGNYIQIERFVHNVIEIHGDGYVITNYNVGANNKLAISIIKPIVITVNWLNKFSLPINFENEHYTIYDFGDTEFQLIHDYAKGLDKFNIAFEGNEIKTVHYVHQLQNLYYFLCNIDLMAIEG